jgi:hypothetical protein
MAGYDYSSLYNVEEKTGVDFDLGWQGLTGGERRDVKDYYRNKYGEGWRKKFRREAKQPARAAGRLGVDVTPESGEADEYYRDAIEEMKKRLNRETGARIRDYTVNALEQAEMGGMPAGTTSTISRYATEANQGANELVADVESQFTEAKLREEEALANAIRNEVLRGKKATGKAIGQGVGAGVGALASLLTGGAGAGAFVAGGSQLGGLLGGGGNEDQYAQNVANYLAQMEDETASIEALIDAIMNGESVDLTAPSGSTIYTPDYGWQ